MSLLPLRHGGGSVPVRRGEGNVQTSPIGRIDPWNDFDYMDRAFDTLFRSPFSLMGRSMPRAESADLNVELYESADDLTAYVFAPGIPQDAFDISVNDDTLTIKAQRKPIFEAGDNVTSHTPWSTLALGASTYSASYTLPSPVNSANVQAQYKDGVVVIRMPRQEAAKARQVQIQVQNG